jgi:hypothetical protein
MDGAEWCVAAFEEDRGRGKWDDLDGWGWRGEEVEEGRVALEPTETK